MNWFQGIPIVFFQICQKYRLKWFWFIPAFGVLALAVGITLYQRQPPAELIHDPWIEGQVVVINQETLFESQEQNSELQGDGTAPLASLSDNNSNLGIITGDEPVSADFVLLNRGNAPLMVTGAKTTCGCIQAEISATLIPPGEASYVKIIFYPGMNEGAELVRRGLILETNDPIHPQLEFWVQARMR